MAGSTLVLLAQDTDSGLSLWEVVGLFGVIPAAITGVIAAVAWRFSRNTNTDRFPLLRETVVRDPMGPPMSGSAGDVSQDPRLLTDTPSISPVAPNPDPDPDPEATAPQTEPGPQA